MPSLTETAKKILMKESDDPTPDRDAKSMTPNMQTLKPGGEFSPGGVSPSYTGRFANPPGSGENVPARWNPPDGQPEHDETQAVVDPNDQQNIGAILSKNIGATNYPGTKPPVPAEQPQQQAAVMEEEFEISEELQDFINEMIEEGYSEEEIAEAIEENFELVSEEKEKEEEKAKKLMPKGKAESMPKGKAKPMPKGKAKPMPYKMMKEHVDALLAGENLSEEFRAKAETIFESAVAVRVDEQVKVLEEAYAKSLEEEVLQISESLTEQVDAYLNYVVEQWISENEVAIETGLRTELTEEFISGLKTLFAEHYIDIPEDKVSVLEGLSTRLETAETRLNEEIDKNIALTKTLNESLRTEIVNTICEGLTATESDKLRRLSENVSFNDVDEFAGKIQTLRESYFSRTVNRMETLDSTDVDTTNSGMITEQLSGPMAAYVKSIGKSLPR